MLYPAELLPQKHYKLITTDKLSPKSFLLRKSSNPNADSEDIRIDELIPTSSYKDFYELSNNLLGIFLEEHIIYRPNKKEYNERWQEGDECMKSSDIEFDLEKNAKAIYFNISKLHGRKFPYSKKIQSKKELETIFYEGTIYILHTPSKCNFWHFEFNMVDEQGKAILRKGVKTGSWKYDAAKSFVKITLRHLAFRKKPTVVDKIPHELYSKK